MIVTIYVCGCVNTDEEEVYVVKITIWQFIHRASKTISLPITIFYASDTRLYRYNKR